MVVTAVDPAAGVGIADTVAELRRRVAAMPGGPGPGGGPVPAGGPVPVDGPGRVETGPSVGAGGRPSRQAPSEAGPVVAPRGVPVPEQLAGVLPGGVLPAGRVTALSGGAGLHTALLARATAAGARCAVVGCPSLGLAAIAEQGGLLDHLALVPEPGADPAAVVSVLLDGLDVVLVDPSIRGVAPSRARVLAGRVRAAGAVLLVGPGWPGAEVHLESRACAYAGLGRGLGRLESVSSLARCSGRGAPPRSVRWTSAACRGRRPGAGDGPSSGVAIGAVAGAAAGPVGRAAV